MVWVLYPRKVAMNVRVPLVHCFVVLFALSACGTPMSQSSANTTPTVDLYYTSHLDRWSGGRVRERFNRDQWNPVEGLYDRNEYSTQLIEGTGYRQLCLFALARCW